MKEAVAISRIRPGLELPAVVYRCVEYLEAKVCPFACPCFDSDGTDAVPAISRRTPNMKKESSGCLGRQTLFACSKTGSMSRAMSTWCRATSTLIRMRSQVSQQTSFAAHEGAALMGRLKAPLGLLKQYLRELPVHILTRELHPEFLRVIGEPALLPCVPL